MTKSVNTLIKEAQILEDAQNIEKAMLLLQEAYEMDSKNPELLEKMALYSLAQKDEDKAIFYWEELLKVDSENYVAYSQLQDLYSEKNRYKYYLNRAKRKVTEGNVNQAVSDFKKAAENAIENEDIIIARFNLARTYEFLNKTNEAADEYYRILGLKENKEVYYNLINILKDTDIASAISVCHRAIENFDDEQFKEFLSDFYIRANEPQKALEYAILDLTKAKIYLMLQENQKAIEILDKIEDKQNEKYLTLMAEYHFNKNEFDYCLNYIENLLKLNPLSPLPYQMKAMVYDEKNMEFEAHIAWGKYYQLRSDIMLACNEFSCAHKLKPDSVLAVNELIKVYENLKDRTMLAEYYEILLNLDEKNYYAMKKLGEYWEEEGDKQRAKKYYERYIEIAPMSVDLDLIKGKVEKEDEVVENYEGFLDKLIGFFSKEK